VSSDLKNSNKSSLTEEIFKKIKAKVFNIKPPTESEK
jgi:hypothetical protein